MICPQRFEKNGIPALEDNGSLNLRQELTLSKRPGDSTMPCASPRHIRIFDANVRRVSKPAAHRGISPFCAYIKVSETSFRIDGDLQSDSCTYLHGSQACRTRLTGRSVDD